MDKRIKSISNNLVDLIHKSGDISDSDYYQLFNIAQESSSLLKVALSVPDRLLARKIEIFFKRLNKKSYRSKEKFYNQISSNKVKKVKVGTMLLEQLNRADSDKKCKYIAAIFCEYISDNINENELWLYIQIINIMYQRDLVYFLSTKEDQIDEVGDETEHLISIGAYSRNYNGFGHSALPIKKPVFSDAGRKMYQIIIKNR